MTNRRAVTQEEFDKWKERMEERQVLEDSASDVISGEPEKRGEARRILEQIINNIQPNRITPQDPTDSILRYVKESKNAFEEMAFSRFAKGPEEFLDKAYKENESKFKRNYLNINPVILREEDGKAKADIMRTGDNLRDWIVQNHVVFYGLNKNLMNFAKKEGRNAGEQLEFTAKTASLIDQELMQHLISQGVSQERAERLMKLFGEAYRLSPNRAYLIAAGASARAKERIEKSLKEDDRAKYAKDILSRKIYGGELNYQQASRELFEIVYK